MGKKTKEREKMEVDMSMGMVRDKETKRCIEIRPPWSQEGDRREQCGIKQWFRRGKVKEKGDWERRD